MPTAGVSGLAVGLMTAGGVLLVAGIKNEPPTDVIRELIKKPTSGGQVSEGFGSVASGVATGAAVGAGVAAAVGAGASAVVGASAAGAAIVAEARKHLGAKYVFAAVGPTTFDCSGLVVWCLRHTVLPNCARFVTANESAYLASHGFTRVPKQQFQAGDILCHAGHTAIATSATTMIHAPHTGTVVKEASIYSISQWWAYRYTGSASTAAVVQGNSAVNKGAGMR